jgi:hypothetical protein
MGISGQACWILSCRARAWTRCSATRDRLEARCVTKPIVGELSLNTAIHFSRSGPHTSSIANQSNRRPAISRSEFVIVLFGFSNFFICDRTSLGHCHLNTVGVHPENSPKITPPMPWLDASTIPMKSGHPQVSSRHLVRSHVDSRSSVWHPSIALRTLAFRCKYT